METRPGRSPAAAECPDRTAHAGRTRRGRERNTPSPRLLQLAASHFHSPGPPTNRSMVHVDGTLGDDIVRTVSSVRFARFLIGERLVAAHLGPLGLLCALAERPQSAANEIDEVHHDL